MVSFKTILVPTDFSEPSKKALTYGLALADQFGAKLVIAHIVSGAHTVEREQDDQFRREIQDFVAAVKADKSDLRIIVRAGRVEEELLGIVAEERVDLVVMGTHGRRKSARWFIGSVTEHMLRKVPVPMLTVSHREGEQHTMGLVALNRILYATDLSESSNEGLKHAIALARVTGAQLTMTHAVYYTDRMLWAPAGIPGFQDEQIRLTEVMRKRAGEVFLEEGLPPMTIETLVVEGKPFERILEIAEAQEMDIIVLNLQSKSTFDRAFLGSTAERVVRLADIPVLSIPLAVTRV